MWDFFRAIINLLAEGFKQFSAEIIAALLFAFCMWKFPSLHSFWSKYIKRNEPEDGKEEILKKLDKVQEELNELKRQRAEQAVDEDSEQEEKLENRRDELNTLLTALTSSKRAGEEVSAPALFLSVAIALGIWYFFGAVIALIYGVAVWEGTMWLLRLIAKSDYKHIGEFPGVSQIFGFGVGAMGVSSVLFMYVVMKFIS